MRRRCNSSRGAGGGRGKPVSLLFDRARDGVGERPDIGEAVDLHDRVGEVGSFFVADLRVAQGALELGVKLVVAKRKSGLAFRVGVLDFARAERAVRPDSTAADVAR